MSLLGTTSSSMSFRVKTLTLADFKAKWNHSFADGGYRMETTEPSIFTWLMTCMYVSLCICGTVGNLWVIQLLFRSLWRKRKSSAATGSSTTQVQLLILVLSIVDTLVLAFVPAITMNLWLQTWYGGRALCKIFWICENLSKVLSTFFLLDMGVYCYLSVCKSDAAKRWNRINGSGIAVVLNTAAGLCLFTPIIQYR